MQLRLAVQARPPNSTAQIPDRRSLGHSLVRWRGALLAVGRHGTARYPTAVQALENSRPSSMRDLARDLATFLSQIESKQRLLERMAIGHHSWDMSGAYPRSATALIGKGDVVFEQLHRMRGDLQSIAERLRADGLIGLHAALMSSGGGGGGSTEELALKLERSEKMRADADAQIETLTGACTKLQACLASVGGERDAAAEVARQAASSEKTVAMLQAPLPHLYRDRGFPRCHICTGTRLASATSALGPGSLLPHLHWDQARLGHICTGIWRCCRRPWTGSTTSCAGSGRPKSRGSQERPSL